MFIVSLCMSFAHDSYATVQSQFKYFLPFPVQKECAVSSSIFPFTDFLKLPIDLKWHKENNFYTDITILLKFSTLIHH